MLLAKRMFERRGENGGMTEADTCGGVKTDACIVSCVLRQFFHASCVDGPWMDLRGVHLPHGRSFDQGSISARVPGLDPCIPTALWLP